MVHDVVLPRFKALLAVYERGSGAENEWEKTHAVRLGELRGSRAVPEGWAHPEIFGGGVGKIGVLAAFCA